jgi:serine/alanine adding enzyme
MFEVLHSVRDAQLWRSMLNAVGPAASDPHFAPEYLDAEHLAAAGVQPGLAVWIDDGDVVIKPIVVRDVVIGGTCCGRDVTSPHGYGGPLSNCDPDLHEAFDKQFTEWCKDCGVICEYMALNPMHLDHQRQLLRDWAWPIRERKPVVWIDVEHPDFSHERRTGIKAAAKAGVRVTSWDGVTTSGFTFTSLYQAAMERKNAAPRWRFRDEYVLAMCKLGQTFAATLDGDVECMSLVLHGGGVAYYHMTANAMCHPSCRANDLLVAEIVEWCRGQGIKKLHLGGGVTSAPDDGVLAFKASFSNLRLPAMSTFRIFDEARYRDACAAKARQEVEATGAEFTTSFEPLYRREAA